jgi:hypothetical protein
VVDSSKVNLSDLLSGPTSDILASHTATVPAGSEPAGAASTTTTATATPPDTTLASLDVHTTITVDHTKLVDDKNNDLLI